MSKLDGSLFKLYYNTAPITSSAAADIKDGTWTEATDVASVSPSSDRAQNDFNARSGVITTIGPAKRALSFEIAYDTQDPFYDALEAAHDNNTPIALADCDGDVAVAGTKGRVGNFLIYGFNMTEPDSGPATVSVEAATTSFVNWGYVAPA